MADWAKLKVVDLKAELKRRDLPQHGLKAELVARLIEADQGEAEPENNEKEDEEDGQDVQGDSPEILGKDDAASSVTVSESAPAEIKLSPDREVQDSDSKAEDTEAPKGSVLSEEQPGNTPEATTEVTAPSANTEVPVEIPQEGLNNISEENQTVEKQKDENTVASEIGEEPMQLASDDRPANSELESQKRKRRSATPPPDEEAIAKRARTEESNLNNKSVGVEVSQESKSEDLGEEAPAGNMDGVKTENKLVTPIGDTTANNIDYERAVSPSVHPATTALYISNLMRPLRPTDIQAHLADLATPSGQPPNDDIITKFYLDQVRSHAFVVFANLSAASRVRNLFHDCVWPNESNRKALWVDFVPPEKVQDWIDKESGNGGRSSTRWEVVYSNDANGIMEAHLEVASATGPRAGPPPAASSVGNRLAATVSADSANNIPIGPRSQRDLGNPPTGPRSKRSGPGPRPPPGPMAGGGLDAKRTQAEPSIGYTPAPEELARRRLDNMRSFYRPDAHRRDLGREFNRYSFENGDGFVDRGKEVFEGIRPPHRERAIRGGPRGGGSFGGGGGGGGRRGGPSRRRGGDRYLPGGGGRGDRNDRPPRRDNYHR